MAKNEVGDRVIVTDPVDGERQRGRITSKGHRSRRVMTDTGHIIKVPIGAIKDSQDRVLLLEGRLDRSLASERLYGEMFQKMIYALGKVVRYERVHTKEDLKRFLEREAKVHVRFIHLMGHGMDCRETGKTRFFTTFEEVDLGDEDVIEEVFRGLDGTIIIFSCCEIGANSRILKKIKEVSGAAAVIAYRKEVKDWYTNLVESMLYERFINQPEMKPITVVEKVNAALKVLGVKMEDVKARGPILVCV